MKAIPTLRVLNKTDDPMAFGGALVDFCVGPNPGDIDELWQFGESYANRSCAVGKSFWGRTKRRVVWNLDFGKFTWVVQWPDLPRVPTGDEKEDGR